MSKYCKTIRNEYPYCANSMYSRDIHFLLFYRIWTLRTSYSNPACFSTFYWSTIHCPCSNLNFLIFLYLYRLDELSKLMCDDTDDAVEPREPEKYRCIIHNIT